LAARGQEPGEQQSRELETLAHRAAQAASKPTARKSQMPMSKRQKSLKIKSSNANSPYICHPSLPFGFSLEFAVSSIARSTGSGP
jgi:hypothetical protein